MSTVTEMDDMGQWSGYALRDEDQPGLELPGVEPAQDATRTPGTARQARRRLQDLSDDEQRQMVTMHQAGAGIREIAAQMDMSFRGAREALQVLSPGEGDLPGAVALPAVETIVEDSTADQHQGGDRTDDLHVPAADEHPEPVTTNSGATALVTPEVLQARRATTPEELPDGPERTVFTHSPATRAVWMIARARMGAPQAVLGAVMAQVVAAVGPHVQLPPLVGAPASLNLLVGLVGNPGGGKGTAEGIANSMFDVVDDHDLPVEVPTLPLGSGEGIAELFTRREGKAGKGDDGEDQGADATPDRVLFRVPEIDSLTAAAAKRESTIMPVLRQAFMGEPLGHTGATRETTRNVPAHSYRVCVVMGIQPRRSGSLLDDADGGTPQRVLWLPVDDPTAPDEGAAPQRESVHRIHLPAGARTADGAGPVMMTLPGAVVRLVRRNRLTRLRGEVVEGLDGHLLLTREKVAAALALMDSRMDVTEMDWSAAGAVINLSTRTREMCRQACKGATEDRAVEREESRDAARDRVAENRMRRARTLIDEALQAGGGRCSRADVHRRARKFRDEFSDVCDEMVEAREIACESDSVTGKVWLLDLR